MNQQFDGLFQQQRRGHPMIRTPKEARAELKRQGISVSAWAVANGFSVALVFEVLSGDRPCVRGQSHKIAVALGLKEGSICTNPAKALERHPGESRAAA